MSINSPIIFFYNVDYKMKHKLQVLETNIRTKLESKFRKKKNFLIF